MPEELPENTGLSEGESVKLSMEKKLEERLQLGLILKRIKSAKNKDEIGYVLVDLKNLQRGLFRGAGLEWLIGKIHFKDTEDKYGYSGVFKKEIRACLEDQEDYATGRLIADAKKDGGIEKVDIYELIASSQKRLKGQRGNNPIQKIANGFIEEVKKGESFKQEAFTQLFNAVLEFNNHKKELIGDDQSEETTDMYSSILEEIVKIAFSQPENLKQEDVATKQRGSLFSFFKKIKR